MNLVSAQTIKFGKLTSTPQLICTPEEAKQFDKFLQSLAVNMDLCEAAGLDKEWYALYDKLADIEIVQDEQKDDMSTARPEVL